MRVAAITRFKQGDLWAALKRLGWTQTELAKRVKISQEHIGNIINLKTRPRPEVADRIQKVLAAKGIYLDVLELWPESFVGFKKSPMLTQLADVPADRLLEAAQAMQGQLPAPDEALMLAEDNAAQEQFLVKYVRPADGAQRSASNRAVAHAILVDGMTYEQAARKYDISVGEARRRARVWTYAHQTKLHIAQDYVDAPKVSGV